MPSAPATGACRRPGITQVIRTVLWRYILRTCRSISPIDVTDCSPASPVPDGDRKFGAGALYLTAGTMQPNLITSVLADTRSGSRRGSAACSDAWATIPIT